MAEVIPMAQLVVPADRRDHAARAVRDRLATRLQVHPREFGSLTFDVASATLARVEELERRLRRLEEQVTVDELTGALRRGAGHEALVREIDRARRSGESLVVVFVDVDQLKRVNDGEGHAAGDRLLQDVADILRAHLRSYDLVIRWGGDEFVCVLPEADLASAARHVDEVTSTFARITYGRTFSVGIAALMAGDDAESLVARADSELYRERRESRRGLGFDT